MPDKSKEHRFDHFAKKMVASMLGAISETLLVFSAPDKERWPTTRLLDYLKSAEALARDMLREMAQKIFVYPAPVREQMSSCEPHAAPNPPEDRAPYFRLNVCTHEPDERASVGWIERSDIHHAESPDEIPSVDCASLNPTYTSGSDEDKSVFAARLTALEDVLTHPGKHAARMARALFRKDEGTGQRLIARSQNDLLLDHINFILDDPVYAESDAAVYMHRLVMDPG